MTTSAAAVARIEHQPREAAPFVKWAGGKGRLLSQLRPLLPPSIARMRHVEPFVGGGALFFARTPARALLTDINPTLVATYTAIRDDLDQVVGSLRTLAARHSKAHYYEVRGRYNERRRRAPTSRAAMFIYLNKTCFNGLHRVNRKGEFNVPIGSYKNPKILNEDALRVASAALQNAELRCTGFESLLEGAKPGDFVYFDPPYEPVSPTASFTSYARDGFSQDDQTRLRDVYRELDRRGCRLMLSNSEVPFIRELYGDFRIDTVAAPRAINCNASGRGKVTEVVVRNYET
ncbi:MAG: DNA adenine methylase [Polyangiales bacterium]